MVWYALYKSQLAEGEYLKAPNPVLEGKVWNGLVAGAGVAAFGFVGLAKATLLKLGFLYVMNDATAIGYVSSIKISTIRSLACPSP